MKLFFNRISENKQTIKSTENAKLIDDGSREYSGN